VQHLGVKPTMAFTYRVAATLPPTPDFAEELVAHFHERGFRLTGEGDGEWTFRRGHKLAVVYRFDIRAYDTVLRVRARTLPEGDLEVHWEYEVWTNVASQSRKALRGNRIDGEASLG
jgi:hypothetical protein